MQNPLDKFWTTASLARHWDVSQKRVQLIAASRRVKPDLVVGRTYFFSTKTARLLTPDGRFRHKGWGEVKPLPDLPPVSAQVE